MTAGLKILNLRLFLLKILRLILSPDIVLMYNREV